MWETTLTLFALVLIMWFWWRKRKLSLFNRLNIPGPPPNFFFGNGLEISRKGEIQCVKEWIEKYGKVLGFYEGLNPALVVADLDIIDTIMVKKFDHYSTRPVGEDVDTVSGKLREYSIVVANGKPWKRLRRIITPMFSSLKLKMMIPIMQQTAEELVDAVERESSKQRPFDILELYQKLTLDTISRTALGLDTKSQLDPDDPLSICIPLMLMEHQVYPKIFADSFPELWCVFSAVWQTISRWRSSGKNRIELKQRVDATVRARKEDPKNRRKDLLQLLIDGSKVEDIVNHSDMTAGKHEDYSINGKENEKDASKAVEKLSQIEIVQNALTMLFAGYETTSTSLGFVTHLLAYNQDIQDEIREEIRSVVSENEEISYETIQKMHILEQAIVESLRLFPPVALGVIRQNVKDTEIQGKKIPKDTRIKIPVYYIHHDPELWEEPEKFNPQRWSTKEKTKYHPMTYQTFGIGPRTCPGKRYAYMEMKLALAKLLQKYKILPAPGAKQENFEILEFYAFIHPKNGIMVEVQKI